MSFNEQVGWLLSDPVNVDLYGSSTVCNEQGTITASQVRLHFENGDKEDVNEQMDTLKEQWDITAHQPINIRLSDYNSSITTTITTSGSFLESLQKNPD